MTTINITAPVGMTGLAVEPWSEGEIYAVAANWAQASSPIMVYGEDGWTTDECGRQVADFRHSRHEALEAIIITAISMSEGISTYDVDSDEVADIMEDAVEIDGE